MTRNVSIRLAAREDVPTAAGIIKLSLDDLAGRQRQPKVSPPGDPMVPALLHVMDVSPDRFWVAEAEAGVVGFGAGLLRGRVCYLAGLFVMPGWQGQGIGRALLDHAMETRPGSDVALAVGSSGTNVISNGMYARHRMYPQLPTLSMTGVVPASLRPASAGGLSRAPISQRDLDEVRELDLSVTKMDRTEDHLWLLDVMARPGWTFRSNGELVGYAYLGGDGTVGTDHLGPVATRETADVAEVLASALVEHGVDRPAVLDVPGSNLEAQRLLWSAGFQMDHAVGLLGASEPLFTGYDRYVCAGNVLL